MSVTTMGRLLLNDALPEGYKIPDGQTWTKTEADDALARLAAERPDDYRDVSHRLMQVAASTVYRTGTTLRLSDTLNPVPERGAMLDLAEAQADAIRADKKLTPEQKREAVIGVYSATNDKLREMTYKNALAAGNPFAIQVASKARGNKSQLASLMTTPGLYEDAQGKTIPFMIRRSYAEGLTPAEYFASTFGARKSIIATKFCLAADTLVLTADYREVRISELRPGDAVFTLDESGRMEPTAVRRVYDNGERACWRYHFRDGSSRETVSADSTEDHEYLVEYRSKQRACVRRVKRKGRALLKGRASAVVPAGCATGGVPEPRAGLLGALLGDGSVSGHNAMVYIYEPGLAKSLENAARAAGLEFIRCASMPSRYTIQDPAHRNGHRSAFITWLRELGVMGHLAPTKTIPDDVYSWDAQSAARLVAYLMETDGCFYMIENAQGCRYPVVSFYCTSAALSATLRRLLRLRFGVLSSQLAERPVAGTVSVFPDGVARERGYDLHGFTVADRTSIARLSELWTSTGSKSEAFAAAVASTRLTYAARFNRRVVRSERLGMRHTWDIEVEHPSHLFVLANGLVVGNSTADAGYLGKMYASALAPMVVTEDDCGTRAGLPVPAGDVDNLGGVLARDAGGFKAGTVVNRQVMAGLKKTGAGRILLRSPTVCRAAEGVCRHCTGLRENGKFPAIGDNVGMNAASAIAERIAQGSLNTKHSGGAASTKDPDSLAGFDVVRDLAMVPSSFPHAATVAGLDGRVEDVRPAPQGGFYVTIGGQQHYALGQPQVNPGDEVEAGDVLNAGIVNPRDVVEHKGIGAGREYFTRRYTRALRDTGYEVNRRNVELLARANINHVRSDEFDGDLLPGDVQQYNKWQSAYQPREDAREVAADGALGQYLERPVAHHTIGTRVTRSMLRDIKDWEPDQKLLVNQRPPGVSAHMESLQYVPQHYPDWQAQLGSNYLERGLLRNVHRGASSDSAGLHPLPRVARGVGLSSDAV